MPSLRGDWNSYSPRWAGIMPTMNYDYSDKNPQLGALYPGHIETLHARHDHALEQAGAAHAVIFSGAQKYAFLDDYMTPFKDNPHFLGWAPLTNLPLSYIVYTPGEKPVLIYNQPRDYWHPVPGMPEGYWTSQFDVRVIHDVEDAAQHLPADLDKCVLIGEIDDAAHAFGIDRINPTSAVNILHYARGVKTAYELACLRLASRRGVAGHLAAAAGFRAQLPEFAIHQAYCKATGHVDNELPYANIIALNEHGAILHYTHLDRDPPGAFRSFLIDAGAQVHGYASDITRTYGNGDALFEALIERMETVELSLVDRVRAGVDFRDLHIEMHRLIAGVLNDCELASGDPETLMTTGVTWAFQPAGLGHLIGLQVHDIGGFMENEGGATIDRPSGHPFLRLTRKLQEDMVLTIEPGVYIIDMLLEELRGTPAESHVNWDTVDVLRPYGGVRIEDDVRVLADGCENLTRDAYAELE